jgi:hypothetical protein
MKGLTEEEASKECTNFSNRCLSLSFSHSLLSLSQGGVACHVSRVSLYLL